MATIVGAGPHNVQSGREVRGKAMETLPSTCVVSSHYHVESCNFSPDGKLLAACFGDFTVRLLRIGEKTVDDSNIRDDHAHPGSVSIHIDLYWVIKEHKNSVWCARFSQDGLLLCTCSSDKTAKIWNVNSRTLERSFGFHTDTVWSCCFAPANSSTKSLIATGSSDQTVKVWSTESNEVLHDLGGYGDAIDCVDFSSSGELLCTSCRDGVVKIWMNLWIAREQSISLESNTDYSVSMEPICICLDLTAVNRSASRFCMFSTLFSSHIKNCEPSTCTSTNNEAATSINDTHKDQTLSDSDAIDLFPNSDPYELLFAGGPENSYAVWTLRDIAIAFKNLPTEKDTESIETYQDVNKESSYNIDEHPNCLSQSEEENEGVHVVDDHVADDSELNNLDNKEHMCTLMDQQSAGTQLGIIEEEEEEGTQADLTEITDREDSNSEMTETSHENSTINGEFSYVSEEPFSFYKVEPRWTLTDHLSTVWDCCTATLHSSNHNVISEEESAKFNDVQVLISCSGDRTLR